ncbi:chitinase [Anaeramoeba flamelloides]|uniref:Chitinase n=1 Tax=Anaeramoeba flamelloides TaxID=1746091 RepID=A0ABQ8X3L8_9EUKA|nr:chitinase [Anaeramoeba flamelloides]
MKLSSLLSILLVLSVLFLRYESSIVMPYMCLERCGFTKTDIADHLEQIQDNFKTIGQVVSFEKFNLGSNSYLVTNNLTDAMKTLKTYGTPTLMPMISTFGETAHEQLKNCRELFINPDPFIKQAVETALSEGFQGYSIDLEPASGTTDEDGVNYAAFLDKFATELHKHDLLLGVDMANWAKIWNLELISKTEIDWAISMSTYAGDIDVFTKYLDSYVSIFGKDRLMAGIMTVNPNTNKPYTDTELKERFDAVTQRGVTKIAIWDMPLPDNWIPFVNDFINN